MCSVIVVVRGERGLAGGEQCGSDAISPTITVVDFLQWPVHMGEDFIYEAHIELKKSCF